MNKIALTLTILAGLSTAAFASQRNQDPDAYFGKNATYTSVQGAAIDSGNTAFDAQTRNMDEQAQSNRK